MKKLKLSLLLFICSVSFIFCQDDLTELLFDTEYYEAVDQWVIYPNKGKDSTYIYGMIYLDSKEGFTFRYESSLKFDKVNIKEIPQKDIKKGLELRLSPQTKLISVLNKNQRTFLNLPQTPDWLADKKKESASVEYLKDIGYHYNHVGASHLALAPLLEAYKKEPHHKGLEFELSYAYNALKQFDEAIIVLEKAIDNDSSNFYFYRELGYAYKNLNKISKAEAVYKIGIAISNNDFEKSEMAVNMAQSYFEIRNKEKFEEWAEITLEYAKEDSQYAKYISIFKENWDKEN